jgi:hypothetical protein
VFVVYAGSMLVQCPRGLSVVTLIVVTNDMI